VILNSMQVAQAAPQGRAVAGLRPAIEGNHCWAPDPHQPHLVLAAARCTPVPGAAGYGAAVIVRVGGLSGGGLCRFMAGRSV